MPFIAGKGCRQPAYITADISISPSKERYEGFVEGLEENGISFNKRMHYAGTFSVETGQIGAMTLLQRNPEIDCIVCGNDLMAIGAVSVCEKLGKKIPEDIKIMELLLYLDALELPKEQEERPYYYKTQVEKVKAIQAFLAEHMAENYTQEDLSARFEIPLTGMKNCFKSVYGMSIGAWLTDYRMNRAAEFLRADREKSVAEIAGLVGYDSASKFAIAFRKIMGMSPVEYRSAIR